MACGKKLSEAEGSKVDAFKTWGITYTFGSTQRVPEHHLDVRRGRLQPQLGSESLLQFPPPGVPGGLSAESHQNCSGRIRPAQQKAGLRLRAWSQPQFGDAHTFFQLEVAAVLALGHQEQVGEEEEMSRFGEHWQGGGRHGARSLDQEDSPVGNFCAAHPVQVVNVPERLLAERLALLKRDSFSATDYRY